MAEAAQTPHSPARSVEMGSAKERLVRAASELFCRQGINATGVDAVVDAAGTAKATLYKVFGSKEGLIEAVLLEEGRAWRDWYLGEINSCRGGPKEKLAGSLLILESWFTQKRFFGCPFINAVGEFDKEDDRYKEIALAHKKQVMTRLIDLAREAGSEDPESLAHQIGLLIDGAIVAAMITGDAQVARHANKAARKLLDLDP